MTSFQYTGTTPSKPTLRPVFIPPKYANFAKNSKDLFKKRFDYSHSLKTIHRSPGGVVFESGVQAGPFPLRGYVKSTVVSTRGYTLEGEANTDPSADTKATIKSASLYPGLLLSASALSNKAGAQYSAEAEYVHDSFTVTTDVKTNLSSHSARVSLSAGYDGIAIGGAVATDLTNGVDVVDYNVGVEYIQPSYIASLFTEQQAETATLSYYQKVSNQLAVGGQARVNVAGDKSAVVTVGNDYIIDAQTSVKSKVEVPTGLVSVALEHRLKNPNVQLNIAANYRPQTFVKGVAAQGYGVGVTFGDY